jgi:MoaA/NifB/PqqE/SkfB family radical SAM enzyme
MPVDADTPFTLILEPVKRCNLHCTYCYSDASTP